MISRSELVNLQSKLESKVGNMCLEELSSNSTYIIADEIIPRKSQGWYGVLSRRKSILSSLDRLSLDQCLVRLKNNFGTADYLNLFVFESSETNTTYHLELVKNDLSYLEADKERDISLHCKVALPPYYVEGEKFSVNWQLHIMKLLYLRLFGKFKK